jgi:glycerate dehydrogenase
VLIQSRSVPNQLPAAVQYSDLDSLIATSDIISLHCPLTPQTKEMINRDSLGRMKKTSFLINISRGGLVVEEDLAQFLNDERIAGAGLDVLTLEPPKKSCPLFKAKNCFITPHIAWATLASRRRLMATAIDNLKAYLAGSPINIVS